MTEQVKRTVVVTGGSRGIGRSICLSLAGPDTHIFFNYFPADDEAPKTEQMVIDAGGSATSMEVDVASAEDVKSFLRKSSAKLAE